MHALAIAPVGARLCPRVFLRAPASAHACLGECMPVPSRGKAELLKCGPPLLCFGEQDQAARKEYSNLEYRDEHMARGTWTKRHTSDVYDTYI